MPKAKKSDPEKDAKAKSPKPLKAEKPAKDKKDKKKAKAVAPAPVAKAPTPVKKAVAEKPKKVVAPEIVHTTEEISLRAYFIAERRQAMGWPGDSSQDWIEAERQLKAEARRKTPKK